MKKTCKDCGLEKEVPEFYTGSRRCRECARILQRKTYDPEAAAKRRESTKAKDPEKWRLKRKEYTTKYENKNKKLLRKKSRDYMREKRKTHVIVVDKVKRRESVERWKKNNPEKWKAQYTLKNKVKQGVMQRPLNCQVCNIETKVDAHHPDYSKPLEVIWCCKKCHGEFHVKINGG